MRFRTPSALILSVALAACQTASDDAGATPVDGPAVETVVVDTADRQSTVVDTAPIETNVVEAAPTPLQISLSVHVEGYQGSPDLTAEEEVVIFSAHRDAVTTVADAASAAGAVVSFEVSRQFADRVGRIDPEFLRTLVATGHDIEVHADIGGARTLPLRAFTDALVAQRAAVESLIAPQEVTHVSGICSRGPWIEAAIDAGFESTNGAVAYCMTSLDPASVPAGSEWVHDCTDAAACHGPMTVTDVQRVYPFLVADSRTFLDGGVAITTPSLVLIVSEAGSSIACLAEAETTPGCTADRADAAAIEADLAEYLELIADSPATAAPPALSYSWSIGPAPDRAAAAAIFAAFQPAVDSGEAVWTSTGDLGELTRRHLEASS